jgi:hypothetical protein
MKNLQNWPHLTPSGFFLELPESTCIKLKAKESSKQAKCNPTCKTYSGGAEYNWVEGKNNG